ncbi:Flagellar FliJ protein [Pseudobythopirellula maris]|uniref:Flagellar FliJ protein n=1 Tax=Pseudobythopirellula maris TaxID=2527991 RepID=A0A5C5ZGH4_9BACT|nr:flagellar FliJ family protein [Pseudobythopirellula maris]TWT86519.1 Flagellar FliJ protein [Pseudobythopirellula maris]
MTPYRFRLQTVERLRAAHRDEQRLRLADAQHAADLLEAQSERLEAEIADLRAGHTRTLGEKSLDIGAVREAQRYELTLRSQQRSLAEQAETIRQETEQRRLALVAAERDVRVLEQLDERLRERHRVAEQQEETKVMDETAANLNLAARRAADRA